MAGQALAAIKLSPNSVNLQTGTYATVQITGANGHLSAEAANAAIATVTLSGVSESGATLNVFGKAAGSTSIVVRSSNNSSVSLPVTVTQPPPPVTLTVAPTSLSVIVGRTGTLTASHATGSIAASSSNTRIATVTVSANVVTVRAVALGSAVVSVKDSRNTVNVPVTVTSPTPQPGKYSLVAWNDLGMHCMDGKDYSVFSILPPFNNLHAQLVNASTGKVVTAGVSLSYEAVADPTGSINTSSAGKTNFWAWVKTIYGSSLAPNVGMTGNATPSLVAKPMVLNAADGWFEATALPITPYDDNGTRNSYPTVKVSARDAAGNLLAVTTTVLPVSDEMNCAACHASRAPTETNTARLAAKPAAGWVNDPSFEVDWKKNVLRLHDQKQAGNAVYTAALAAKGLNGGLYASALAGTPSLCATCHVSNALPGYGQAGVSTLTSALHGMHSTEIDPSTMAALDADSSRSTCYLCHPGSVTQCLRGAMGDPVDTNGNPLMSCQSCHANMAKLGNPSRVGWLQEPNCQACHSNGKRALSAVDTAGNLLPSTDARFATNANTPGAGFSLFRFSKGHGGLQCEACHGSTHAEFPSSQVNDNLQSVALQGYAGTVRECTVCHSSVPDTADGGPHGLHTIGSDWVSRHGSQAEGSGAASCAYCHGSDYRGGPLAQVKAPRSYSVEGRSVSYAAGQNVGCYDCHNGPKP